VEVPNIMRALDPEVVDALWIAVEPLIPEQASAHPLGCHRPRIPDRVCLAGIVVRLATGCSWEDAERLLGGTVSDTTLRGRRDEWITAGVFDRLVEEALEAYDRIIGLDLSECSIDAGVRGPGTGQGPPLGDPAGRAHGGAVGAGAVAQAGVLLLGPGVSGAHMDRASLAAEPRRVLTARAARWATDQVAAIEATPASIARRFGVSWSTVWAAIARETAGRVTAPGEAAPPSMLGFDESVMVSARRRRRRQLVTAVVDVATGRTIDVFEGRDAADLRAWLTCMPAGVARRGPGGVGRPTRGLPVSGGAPRPAHRTGEPPRRRHRGGRSVPHRAGAPRGAMCSEAGERSASPGCRSSLVKLRAA
jgi:transposase